MVLPTGVQDSLWDASEAYLGIVGIVQDLGYLGEETKVGEGGNSGGLGRN